MVFVFLEKVGFQARVGGMHNSRERMGVSGNFTVIFFVEIPLKFVGNLEYTRPRPSWIRIHYTVINQKNGIEQCLLMCRVLENAAFHADGHGSRCTYIVYAHKPMCVRHCILFHTGKLDSTRSQPGNDATSMRDTKENRRILAMTRWPHGKKERR